MDVLRELGTVLPLSLAANLTQWCCSGKIARSPENIQHITSAVLSAVNSFYEAINFIQKNKKTQHQFSSVHFHSFSRHLAVCLFHSYFKRF